MPSAAILPAMHPVRFRLCMLLTRELCALPPVETLRRALQGGVDMIQLREKGQGGGEELQDWAHEVRLICSDAGVPLIINDSVDLALAVDADGVHLGQEDMHPDDARALLGADKLIGLSCHDLEQLDEAGDLGLDYAGYGPVFATETKSYSRGMGSDALLHACAIARLPVLAIGGITVENRGLLGDYSGVAVSSALCGSREPEKVAQDLLTLAV